MLLPLFLLALPSTFSVRTLHLKNLSPSQAVTHLNTSRFAQSLEQLIPDEQKNTLVVSGPTPAVDSVAQVVTWLDIPNPELEFQVTIQESKSTSLERQLQVSNNALGLLTVTNKDRRYQVELLPHLNSDKSLSVLITTRELHPSDRRKQWKRISGIGMTMFRRVSLDQTVELHAPTLFVGKGAATPYLPIRITPRLKK
ncbi:hypothetical protein [Armatimonas rosea]|uniref:NolW-like domain-containing protein n=1 Tax=Armatimonas rosea TaxID=685828 RepID=A0A7W9SN64_ARMRO|nr:hypothetical protein [Armatimonas rosea]MBB6048943.1 hypothetical protein [Armatimonas rosea]